MLSVVIVAQNEERIIVRTIAAVKPIAYEIIVVDSGSTDNSVKLAEALGAKVVYQQWLGYSAQKNFALDLAQGDWILSLDADEVLTPHLVIEIDKLLASSELEKYDGYKIPRVLYIGDRPIVHGGFYPDAQLRLIRRGTGKFNNRLVHEAIELKNSSMSIKASKNSNDRVGQLQRHMDHYAYGSIAEFASEMDKYARLSAQEYINRGKSRFYASRINQYLHPGWTFFYRYILRGGILDGSLGLKLALIYSDYVRKKILYFRQLVE